MTKPEQCQFCHETGLQFAHGHYHCPRCGSANFECCSGETAVPKDVRFTRYRTKVKPHFREKRQKPLREHEIDEY